MITFDVVLKYSPGGTVKDYRNPQSGHQVPKTLRNNKHNTTTFSTQTRTCLRPHYYGRQSCRRLVCQRRGIRRKQLRAFTWSTDCVKSTVDRVKADSHIACRAHAVPLPCRALIRTRHAAPLPCSESAVSFVKVRVVAGNIRTASPTV